MNRRDFLKNILKTTGAIGLSTMLPQLINSSTALASPHLLLSPNLHIKNNSFTFAELESRERTDVIIIHHSAIPSSTEVTAKDVDAMHKANGWAGIGYHMFIHPDGLIETGRPLEDVGAHTFHHNMDSIGICLHGNFMNEYPTDHQMSSLRGLVALLCQMYSLKPGEETIQGHRDFNATACPGDHLYAQLGNLRTSVARIL